MLNRLKIVFVYLLHRYPFLYKVTDYLLTTVARFYSYLYRRVFTLKNKFENKFPILYSITLYIYSEYFAIINGDL
jgi:hypothetical protein